MATLISTPQELDNIRNNLSATYELTNDIDMSGWGNFQPIGNYITSSDVFTGHFDGKGYKITNLTINYTGNRVGLFGAVMNGAEIKNLGVENANVSTDGVIVGALVGYGKNITISNCFGKNCSVKTNTHTAGGLIGYSDTNSITDCFVSNVNIDSPQRNGVFVGFAQSNNNATYNISNSYAVGTINHNTLTNTDYGGFVGVINKNSGYVPQFTNCYYDSNVFGEQKDSATSGVIPRTTEEMKTQSSYTGWDFTDIWAINNDYPTLRVFDHSVPPQTVTQNVSSFISPITSNVQAIHPNRSIINVVSDVSRIDSKAIRGANTSKYTKSFILPFYGDIQANNKRVFMQEVSSYLASLSSSVTTQKQAIHSLISFVGHINGKSVSIFPMPEINAYSYFITNPTNTGVRFDPTNVFFKENPSFMEVKE